MKKILVNIGLVLVGALSIVSCQSDNFDNKFDENPTERTEKRRTELRNNLMSSEYGWKMTYFTDNSQLGGFSYLFKFLDDSNVEMISDFDNKNGYKPLEPRISEYDILLGNTVGLLFTTDNYIHLLANNSIYPSSIPKLKGQGYKGDFEFSYYGSNDEGLDFKSVRKHINVKFEAATAQDWVDFASHSAVMDQLSTKKNFVIENVNGEVEEYNFTYRKDSRFGFILTPDYYSVNVNGGVGFGFAKDHVKISPEIELEDGTVIDRFELVGGVFQANVNGNVVTIR